MKARWRTLKNRCRNPNATAYRWYGARGVEICERWASSFDAFLSDVGMPPAKNYSLDRIDNNGHYEPGNVRWATQKQQVENATKAKNKNFDASRSYLADMDDTYEFMFSVDEVARIRHFLDRTSANISG